MAARNEIKRCAVYTRKSTEEGLELEFNSLDAQFEACSSYIKSQVSNGWHLIDKRYDDGGYSGGNVNRPGLKELQRDIENGKIDIVVVYKIDRLSRSLCDFTDLSKLFEQHGVSFVSVTQQIDTSNAAGRMMLNILMSFAQFEREMTADRIRDKIFATRKKGLWTGGVTPFGYKVVEKQLEVDPLTADAVRMMFRRYAATGSSRQVARELNAAKVVRPNGGHWLPRHVTTLLRNCIYIGKLPIKRTGDMFDGIHEAIVDEATWNAVQRILDENRPSETKMSHRETLAPLKGLLKCGTCGSAMAPVFSNYKGRKNRHYIYYRCVKDAKRIDHTCPIRNVSAEVIDRLVYQRIGRVLQRPDVIRLVAGGDADKAATFRRATSDMEAFWENMVPAERDRLFRLLVREVLLFPDKVEIVLMLPEGEEHDIVSCSFKTNLGRSCVVVPNDDGCSKDEPEKMAVLTALGRSVNWCELLTSATYKNKQALAKALGLSPSYLTKLLRFPFLSPILVSKIVNGELPEASVTKLLEINSPFWADHEIGNPNNI